MIAVASPAPRPRVRACLRRALRDVYEESWRLMLLNGALGAYVLAVLAVAVYIPAALVLLLGAGPLLAAIVRAATTLVEDGSLSFVDIAAAYRETWRRGIVLALLVALAVAASWLAVAFYGGRGPLAWPFAVLALYLGGLFALHQLLLWPIACREPRGPLVRAAREAGLLLVQRPFAAVGLALALLAVNVLGLALGALPFLTLTIAYSAVVATRFALGEE